MQRVEIEWIDSGISRNNGWESTETTMEHINISKHVVTHGLLVGEDDEKIVVALTFDEGDIPDEKQDTWFSAFAVYKPNIIKVTTWRVREEVKAGEGGRFFPKEDQ